MGMFDTVSLDPPVACPNCGKLHDQTQTKHFTSALLSWKAGDVLQDSPVTTGILRDSVHCCRLAESDKWTSIDIYLVIWHGVFAGHTTSETDAEARLSRIDRLDLLDWLDKAQQETREWKARYKSLRTDVKEWLEEQKNPRAQRPERERLFGIFNALPEEILNDPDPLSRILERNDEALPARRGILGY